MRIIRETTDVPLQWDYVGTLGQIVTMSLTVRLRLDGADLLSSS